MRRYLLMIGFAMLGGETGTVSAANPAKPSPSAAPSPAAMAAPVSVDPLRVAMLSMHNAARARVGVPPLLWDDRLAQSALSYAQAMARTGLFRHAPPALRQGEGENLWTGSHGAYDYAAMASAWTDEARLFVNYPTPMFSITGRWQDVGHYSQIVWRSTTALGCAMASNATDDYVVCRYGPPGNVIGRTAF